jgi:hypothetical protein
VRERIRGCKLELAGTEFPLPNSQNLQREVFTLTAENRLLKQQLDEARNHPGGSLPPPAAPAPAAPAAPAAPVAPATPTRAVAAVLPRPGAPAAPGAASPVAPTPAGPVVAGAAHPRTYVIQANDSIYAIATRYGLKTSAVLAANPNIAPTHLRIGQNLNLP